MNATELKVVDNTGGARLWANMKSLLGGYVKTISYSGHTMTITKGDGTTSSFNTADNNTTYSVATQSANGLLSSTDKTKLDGIATGANKYTLPKATASALGGIKIGANLSIDSNGVVSATDTKYSNATTSADGLMSKTDKATINSLVEATEAEISALE